MVGWWLEGWVYEHRKVKGGKKRKREERVENEWKNKVFKTLLIC